MTDRRAARLPVLNRAFVTSAAYRQTAPPPGLDVRERAVQFGTGALLRGFVEYFLDEANRQGCFNGRIILVGSTASGRGDLFAKQNGLYTLIARGIQNGGQRTEQRVIGVVSRALSAATEWQEVLACAREPALEFVFSNTTETGIAYDEHDLSDARPPQSFPGKLTRFLYERARAFDFDADRGVVVLPCELIEDNGTRLREIVLQLASQWGLPPQFAEWLSQSVPFCNTLVDRIVPGTPAPVELADEWTRLGYRDELLTTAELYRSFIIEGDDALRARLSFAAADPAIEVVDNVGPYRERKVRLLNGAHTAMVAAALLSDCATVGEAMDHELLGPFIRKTLLDEIVPTLAMPGAAVFADAVLDRFANPFISHALIDITLQHTTKLRVRVIPSIVGYVRESGQVPGGLALGFAAYILYMRGDLQARRQGAGLAVPTDDLAARVRAHWTSHADRAADLDAGLERLTAAVCSDTSLWGTDLSAIPGFVDRVFEHLAIAARDGVPAALEAHLASHAQPGAGP